jgi:hypothetical protein
VKVTCADKEKAQEKQISALTSSIHFVVFGMPEDIFPVFESKHGRNDLEVFVEKTVSGCYRADLDRLVLRVAN